MSHEVTDTRSNPNENIAHAAKVLQKSDHRKQVFIAIYAGQKKIKTQEEIADKTGLPPIRITQEATVLYNNSIITRKKLGNKFAYGKDKFYNQYKTKILTLAKNKNKLSRLPTKTNPSSTIVTMKIPAPKQRLQDIFITIDDVDSFAKVKSVKSRDKNNPIYENDFKEGIKKILNEGGTFKDWGGEKNDLLTTRLKLNGKKMRTAFGFKGRGKSGVLTPNRMGKNGDQIQRLFESAAEVFFVQYWDKISEKIIEQMEGWAQLQSLKENKKIYYGVIDGQDTNRLLIAYKGYFPKQDSTT